MQPTPTRPGDRGGPAWPDSVAGWPEIRVLASTGSTNADVLAAAATGQAAGLVVLAEHQQAGRGRLGRTWTAPPGSSLTFSVLLRPARPVARHGWIPLLAGLAVVEALAPETGVDLSLKWPNDVLAGGRKVAGLLAERAGGAVVVGIGVNVSQSQDQLPAAEATSLMLAGSRVSDRVQLLRAVLARLDARLAAWDVPADQTAAADAELAAAYRAACATLGRSVRAQLPGGRSVTGLAQDIDAQGRLQVMSADRLVAVAAGEVVHLR